MSQLDAFHESISKLSAIEIAAMYSNMSLDVAYLKLENNQMNTSTSWELLTKQMEILDLAFERKIATIMKKHETPKKESKNETHY